MAHELAALLGKALSLFCSWLEGRRREQAEQRRSAVADDGAGALIRLFNPAAKDEPPAPAHPEQSCEDEPGR